MRRKRVGALGKQSPIIIRQAEQAEMGQPQLQSRWLVQSTPLNVLVSFKAPEERRIPAPRLNGLCKYIRNPSELFLQVELCQENAVMLSTEVGDDL